MVSDGCIWAVVVYTSRCNDVRASDNERADTTSTIATTTTSYKLLADQFFFLS